MTSVRTATLVLVCLLASGCSSLAWDSHGAFGAPDEAWLLLARGESGESEAGFGEVEDHWRQRLCETEREAEGRLAHQVREEVETAWAKARLDQGGKELPALTDSTRDRMVAGIMAEARLVGRVRPESGRFESFYGVRVSGRLAACLRETRSGGECARPPVMEPVSACGDLTPAPEPLYFLEGT
ncbi:hypothetical protein [Vreelandella utahensis]|uniref:hypothetical protein n=1 Tax=Vreelandella halophila TaxID=86177 RepID=UPI00117AC97D|nr:hypothetical protein [Halomonas utahensis]